MCNEVKDEISFGGWVMGVLLVLAIAFVVVVLISQRISKKPEPANAISSSMVTSVVSNMKPVMEATENEEQKGVETNGITEFRGIKTKLVFGENR
jgi:hypothetical protein